MKGDCALCNKKNTSCEMYDFAPPLIRAKLCNSCSELVQTSKDLCWYVESKILQNKNPTKHNQKGTEKYWANLSENERNIFNKIISS